MGGLKAGQPSSSRDSEERNVEHGCPVAPALGWLTGIAQGTGPK